jgi:phosphate transport system substrate-binding protein
MKNWKHTPGSLVPLAMLLALAATPNLQAAILREQPLVAQAVPTFPLPNAVAENTTIRIDGSSSLQAINTALKQSFEKKFAKTQVQAATSGGDNALKALREGKIDLAAIGRPLTAAEKAEGLVAVPIARNKIAIVVGASSPFQGTLTNEQFAGIVRGEITDWSEIDNRVSGPIRLVDRPDTSDTRKALQTYPVFQKLPFDPGPDTIKVADDSTAAMVSKLGADGLGYAIADQVLNKPGVKILDMYGTLPTDPKYPFSQPLSYVYKGSPNAAVQAFLGLATAADSKAAIEQARVAAVMSAPGATMAGKPESGQPAAKPSPEKPADGQLKPGAEGAQGAAKPGTPGTADLNAPQNKTPDANQGANQGAPGADGQVAAPSPGASATPQNDGDFFGGLFSGLNTTIDIPGIGAFPLSQLLWLLIPLLGIPLLLWLLRGGGDAAGDAAGATIAGGRRNRLILTPRNCRDAYAYWEVNEDDLATLRSRGGETLALRLYDITDLDWQTDSPHSIRQFEISDRDRDKHLPIALDDRDYQVELGYVTRDGEWLPLAESEPVHVPKCGPDDLLETGDRGGIDFSAAQAELPNLQPTPQAQLPNLQTPDLATSGQTGIPLRNTGAGLTGAAVAGAAGLTGAAMAALSGLSGRTSSSSNDAPPSAPPPRAPQPPVPFPDRIRSVDQEQEAEEEYQIILVPRNCRDVYVYWEISPAKQAELRRFGREPLRVRLYDVTDLSIDIQQPHSVRQFVCPPGAQDVHLPIALDDRDYLVELGYLADQNRWVKLSRSSPIHVPQCGPNDPPSRAASGIAASPAVANRSLLESDRAPASATDSVSRIVLAARTPTEVSAHWEVSDDHKAVAKRQGGQKLALRLYDVTGINMDMQPPHSIYQFEVDENSQDRHLPVRASDRDYLVELGYVSDEGHWLRLARSLSVRVPSDLPVG